MNGHFVVMDDSGLISGVYTDDDSAQEHIDALRRINYPMAGVPRVRALCPVCAEHLEAADGVCTQNPEVQAQLELYDRTVPVMHAILEGLRRL